MFRYETLINDKDGNKFKVFRTGYEPDSGRIDLGEISLIDKQNNIYNSISCYNFVYGEGQQALNELSKALRRNFYGSTWGQKDAGELFKSVEQFLTSNSEYTNEDFESLKDIMKSKGQNRYPFLSFVELIIRAQKSCQMELFELNGFSTNHIDC